MASRRSRGKSRYKRRMRHAIITKGRPSLIAAVERITAQPLLDHQKAILEQIEERAKPQHHALSSVPVRAQCPECGYSQKVKRDGTMGKHDVGTETKRQCAGTGRKWND